MYKIILPIRYLIKRRITYLAVIAVGLSVFTVTVVMTVMNGLVADFAQKNHDFVGDCVVSTDSLVGFGYYEDFLSQLNEADFIQTAAPVIKSFALITSELSGKNVGVEIMGIDPKSYSRVTGFARSLHFRKDQPSRAFEPAYDTNLPGCIVGIDMMVRRDSRGKYHQADNLPRWSYSISCFPLSSKGALVRAGFGPAVNTRTFYYSDNLQTGLAKVDGNMIYLPFDDAQRLCGMNAEPTRASAIHIKFSPGLDLEQGTKRVTQMWSDFAKKYSSRPQAYLLNTVSVQSWKSYRREIIAPMEKEATMMLLLFIMVGAITIFVVLVVFYMIISHKSKDIGILKSLGTSFFGIITLFLSFAFLIGVIGSGLGLAAGCAFLTKINAIEDTLFEKFGWQLWNREIYAIGDIPSRIEYQLLAIVFVSAILACLIGAFLPSQQVARGECAKILQVDQL